MMKTQLDISLKNYSMPVQDIQMFVDAGAGQLCVFNGPDEQFIAGRMMGACGGIGGTYGVMTGLFLNDNQLFIAGKLAEARELQYEICRIIYAMCACHGSMYAVIKELLRRKGGNCGSVRPPFPALIPEDMKQIDVCEKMLRDTEKKYLGI